MDREIEFIKQKHIINTLLNQTFLDYKYQCLNFDRMSCEHIAVWLLEKLQCEAVSVGEEAAKRLNYTFTPKLPF